MSETKRNPRKFRIYESENIVDTLSKLLQMQDSIDKYCEVNDTTPMQMPPSLVPTDLLYDFIAAYDIMYDQLLKENLLNMGNPKLKHQQLH